MKQNRTTQIIQKRHQDLHFTHLGTKEFQIVYKTLKNLSIVQIKVVQTKKIVLLYIN